MIRFSWLIHDDAKHGALIVEDAAESFGASYKGKQTGCFGDVSILSGNGNNVFATV